MSSAAAGTEPDTSGELNQAEAGDGPTFAATSTVAAEAEQGPGPAAASASAAAVGDGRTETSTTSVAVGEDYAAAAEDAPGPLLAQLKIGGIMVLPVGQSDTVQSLIRVHRHETGYEYEELRPVRFVPLVEGLAKDE